MSSARFNPQTLLLSAVPFLLLLVTTLHGIPAATSTDLPDPTVTNYGNTDFPDGRYKLLVILLDGFRWDYVKNVGANKGFERIKTIGVSTEYLVPAFPSMSFPNYYTLATGLFVENHGFVMNHMYDTRRREFFDMLPSHRSHQSYWWDEAEPLWTTATRKGLRAELFLWPGGDVRIRDTLPQYALPYRLHHGLDEFRLNLAQALDGLANNRSDLALVYCEHADDVGHTAGPNSDRLHRAVVQIDEEIGRLIDTIDTMKMNDVLNVVIVSDHGMTGTGKGEVERLWFKPDVVDLVDYIVGHGAIVGIFPRAGQYHKVDAALKGYEGIHVWNKADLPERFHMKDNSRTPPIIVLAKKGYFIVGVKDEKKQVPFFKKDYDNYHYRGFHGYDPEEELDMRGIFYAFGPKFENGLHTPGIHSVDVYNLLMNSLDLQPLPNNGSWRSVFNMVHVSAAPPFGEGLAVVCTCLGAIYMSSLLLLVNSTW